MTEVEKKQVEKKLKALLDRGDIDSIRQAIELGDVLNVDDKIFQQPISIFIHEYLDQPRHRFGDMDVKDLSELEEVLSWIKKFRLKLLKDRVQKIVDKNYGNYVVVVGWVIGNQILDDDRLRATLTKAIKGYLGSAGVPLSAVKGIFAYGDSSQISRFESSIHDGALEYLGAKWITDRI